MFPFILMTLHLCMCPQQNLEQKKAQLEAMDKEVSRASMGKIDTRLCSIN